MRQSSAKLLVVAVLAVGSMGLVANNVLASVSTVKGKGKVFSHFSSIISAAAINNDVVTVPEKQTFVLTDIIVSNVSANANQFALRCLVGADIVDLLPLVDVASGTSWQHSFNTGLECHEGETMKFVASTANASQFKAAFVGYFRKGD